jgi:hypothetical protein
MLEEIRPAALADHENGSLSPSDGAPGRGWPGSRPWLKLVQSLTKPFDVYLAPHQIDKAGRCQRERDDRESQHIDHGHSPGVSVGSCHTITALSRPRPVTYFTVASIFFRRCAGADGARAVLDHWGEGRSSFHVPLSTRQKRSGPPLGGKAERLFTTHICLPALQLARSSSESLTVPGAGTWSVRLDRSFGRWPLSQIRTSTMED